MGIWLEIIFLVGLDPRS